MYRAFSWCMDDRMYLFSQHDPIFSFEVADSIKLFWILPHQVINAIDQLSAVCTLMILTTLTAFMCGYGAM